MFGFDKHLNKYDITLHSVHGHPLLFTKEQIQIINIYFITFPGREIVFCVEFFLNKILSVYRDVFFELFLRERTRSL